MKTGTLVSFRFDPDPAVQPQASAFYALLASPTLDSDDVITQPAQVREIDQQDLQVRRRRRCRPASDLCKLAMRPAFDEQDVLNNANTSPGMTAVMAAFERAGDLEKHTIPAGWTRSANRP